MSFTLLLLIIVVAAAVLAYHVAPVAVAVVLVFCPVDGHSARGAGVAADDAAQGEAGQGSRAAVDCRREQPQQASE